MNSKISDALDYTLITVGSAVGVDLVMAESILGIIILSMNILWLLIKMIIKITNIVKNKKLSNEEKLKIIDSEIENAIKELDEKRKGCKKE